MIPEYKGVILNEIPDVYPLFKESMIAKMDNIAIVHASCSSSGDENIKDKNKGKKRDKKIKNSASLEENHADNSNQSLS